MSLAIQVEHLSKKYRLGVISSQTFRDDFSRWWKQIKSRSQAVSKTEADVIWALQDVNFQVEKGAALGIVGANGAGKSTLLKILARVTAPTTGTVKIKGRLASLLEVGTGFHPELTGRDNIFLNGVILGMNKSEITRRLDEIVAFSEIERFIDTPVKHYSTGMYVRLAFAVAAHVDADILLVDEALAVGDASFQKKCLTKMHNLTEMGRTILYVSHNLTAIEHLCRTGYFLDHGKIIASGEIRSVVEAYYRMNFQPEDSTGIRPVPKGMVRFQKYEVLCEALNTPFTTYSDASCTLMFYLETKRVIPHANFGLSLWDNDGSLLFAIRSLDYGGKSVYLKEGLYKLQFKLPSLPLRPGSYSLHVSANDLDEGTLDAWYAKPKLQVLARKNSGLPPQWQGILDLKGEVEVSPI